MLVLFFILLAFACFRGLFSDYGVMMYLLMIGFLQDPVRKVIAGEPVIMTVMVGVVLAACSLRIFFNQEKTFSEPFNAWSKDITAPLNLYLIILLVQASHSLIRYGSPILTSIGSIFYLAPLVAIVVGYFHFKQFRYTQQFLLLFCIFAFVACMSVLASYFGYESAYFGEVGSGLLIYDQGTILKAYSGLMRSSEIASWHMGACVCLIIILAVDRGELTRSVFASIIILVLIAAIILTGRRKMLLQIVVFAAFYLPILRYYQGRLSVGFIPMMLASVFFMAVAYWFLPSIAGTEYDLYIARGVSVFNDAGERFASLGLGSIQWAYNAYGFFGGGLGVAAQGSQHFVQGHMSAAGEGGIGKLVSELGVFSLLILAWLSFAFARHLHRCLKMTADLSPEKLVLVVGVLVFLVSNVPTFMVASQVFGDVFVLLILGLLTGSLFALPKQVELQIQERPNHARQGI